MSKNILYLGLFFIILIISIFILKTTSQNKEQIKEGFDIESIAKNFDKSQESYFEERLIKDRLTGTYVPGQEKAEQFIRFDPSKPIGDQLLKPSPILEEQQRQIESNIDNEVKKCKYITSCDDLNGTKCGYCFFNDRFYYGDQNGPLTDVCPGGWVKTKEQCQERRERAICDKVTSCREMIGDATICGWCPTKNKAFVAKRDSSGKLVPKYASDKCENPSILGNIDIGLISGKDCDSHPCMGPNMNSGPHSITCLSKLYKSSGCTPRGEINPSRPGKDNSWWNQRGWNAVLKDMKLWKSYADSSNWNLAKTRHRGCYGTDADPCDPKYSPRPTECIQKIFLESGCNKKGTLYNQLGNKPLYKSVSKSGLQSWFKGLFNNTRSSNYNTKSDANMRCLGVKIPPSKLSINVDNLLVVYYKGCFRDRGNRAMPHSITRKGTFKQIIKMAKEKGYKYVGLQYANGFNNKYAEAWGSNSDDYDKYGIATNCTTLDTGETSGQGWSNAVYMINDPLNPNNYVMYGPWIGNKQGIPINKIIENNGKIVYLSQDGRYTKIVTVNPDGTNQQAFYYVGQVSQYSSNKSVTNAGKNYMVRNK